MNRVLGSCKIVEADLHSDIEQIIEVDELSFNECHTSGSMLRTLTNPNNKMLLCIDSRNDDVLGYMIMLRHKSRDESEPDREQVSITRIAVHPSTRQRGIGRLFIENAVRMAKGIDASALQLVVKADDISIGSQFFIERAGFILSATAGVLNLYSMDIESE